MSEKKLTIKEIARIAGVSKGTVSRVINDNEGVGPDTRIRIKSLIKKLDYEPNAFARGLAEKKTRNIGIIIPHEAGYFLSNNYWPYILSSVSKLVVKKGYSVVLSTTLVEGEIDYAYQSMFVGSKVDGLVVGAELITKEQYDRLMKKKIPFVMIGKSPFSEFGYVNIDNHHAINELTTHVINQGFKKILFMTGPVEYKNVEEQIAGFCDTLAEYKGCEGKVFSTCYNNPEMDKLAKELLSDYKPDALILGAGDFVLRCMKLLNSLEISVPHDLGLATFDSLDWFDIFSPRITALKQPVEMLGSLAVEMLFSKLEGAIIDDENIILECSLEIRESCREKL